MEGTLIRPCFMPQAQGGCLLTLLTYLLVDLFTYFTLLIYIQIDLSLQPHPQATATATNHKPQATATATINKIQYQNSNIGANY